MKKNKMMRLASGLLVAVLLTTCAISGTFAKYVTSDTGSDIARVARWGVQVDANGDLFLVEYATTDKTTYDGDVSVKSGNTWKVVAPGTNGAIDEVALAGTPEVAVNVTYDATLTLDGWKLSDNTEYCPIVITVEDQTYGIAADCGVNNLNHKAINVADLKQKVEAAIESCKAAYNPLTNLAEQDEAIPSVTWKWNFHTSDANDIKDTDLGNKAAVDNYPVIKLDVTTTVTQID